MLQRFTSDIRGNFAIIFALLLMPVMFAVGAAVDYTAARGKADKLQAASDAAVLSAAADASTLHEFKALARSRIDAMADGIPFQLKALPTLTTVDVTIEATHKTSFLGLAGQSELPIRVETGVVTDKFAWNVSGSGGPKKALLPEGVSQAVVDRARDRALQQVNDLPYHQQDDWRRIIDGRHKALSAIVKEHSAPPISLSR